MITGVISELFLVHYTLPQWFFVQFFWSTNNTFHSLVLNYYFKLKGRATTPDVFCLMGLKNLGTLHCGSTNPLL